MTKNRDKRLRVMTKISLKKLIFRILRGAWSKFLFCIEKAKMKKKIGLCGNTFCKDRCF